MEIRRNLLLYLSIINSFNSTFPSFIEPMVVICETRSTAFSPFPSQLWRQLKKSEAFAIVISI